MFRKLHIQMTIYSTLVTGGILLLMTLVCLFISESGTARNSYTTFTNNVNSCISHLEGQSVISHQWLQQVRNTYGIEIEIRDNGVPLFYDKLNPTPEVQGIFQKTAEISKDTYALDPDNLKSVSVLTRKAIFRMDGYYAGTALIPHDSGVLSVIILYSLKNLNQQLFHQHLAFFAAVLVAVLALAVFSWIFTRILIRPLEDSRKRQTEFIASASHELRSPLAVIRSSIAAMEKASPEDSSRFLEIMKKEENRMAELINDMLELANADNHSWQLNRESCELDTVLLETYEKYEPIFRGKRLHLDVILPEDPIPPLSCDAARISQVLGILLDNALSYVPAHGCITLSMEQNDKNILVFVADNGLGIPDDAKESVFLRFYRADPSRNSKQHFGLGLCIAKEIIQLHKGTIRVMDTPGGGATFRISLPKT